MRLHRHTDGERDEDGDGNEPGGVRHAGLSAQSDVMSDPDPTPGWQAIQCESSRLTRVRGVPVAPPAGMGRRLIAGGACLFNVNLTMRSRSTGESRDDSVKNRDRAADELTPDELTLELAEKAFATPQEGRSLGVDPETGHEIVAKDGRYGPYVTEVLPEPDDGDEGNRLEHEILERRP